MRGVRGHRAKPSGQPRDHADINGVALGDIGQPFPGSPTLDGLCELIIGKLRPPTELHASGHGPLTAVARTIADLFHLETVMASGNFFAYYRVSSKGQGASWLGLESEKSAVETFLNGGRWKLVADFTE